MPRFAQLSLVVKATIKTNVDQLRLCLFLTRLE